MVVKLNTLGEEAGEETAPTFYLRDWFRQWTKDGNLLEGPLHTASEQVFVRQTGGTDGRRQKRLSLSPIP